MWKIKTTYASGYSDIGECDTEAQAREAVTAATLSMTAGLDGISDVTAWEV